MSEEAIFRVPDGFEDEWPGAHAAATEVVLNLVRVGDTLSARVDAFVRGFGLPSSTALVVLAVLRGERGPLQPSVVASRSFLSRPALSGVIDTLERRGYLRRFAHATDRRGSLVEITAAGSEIMEQLLPALHRAEVEWTAALAEGQQRSLVRLLGRLQHHLLGLDAESNR